MRLGIDFGTTRTVVAAVDRGNYPVISFQTETGDMQPWYPSLIAARANQTIFGLDAQAHMGEPGWVFLRSFKRALGDLSLDSRVAIGSQSYHAFDLLVQYLARLRLALCKGSNLELPAREPLDGLIAVPANANSNQRFLTLEAFRRAGFRVLGMINEPSAAGIEFAHQHARNEWAMRKEYLVVYDLGGGTFDASVIGRENQYHQVLTDEGIAHLGGDDFDVLLRDLALERASVGMTFTDAASFQLLEECRRQKESLHPNTRRIAIDIGRHLEGAGTVMVPVDEFYERCQPLVERTITAVEAAMARARQSDDVVWNDVAVVYLVGGSAELPIVSRMLRERYGRRVRRSPYPHSATAIGLAIAADAAAGHVLRERFTRHFGVWREADSGTRVVFDPIFSKDSLLPRPQEPPLLHTRSYHPAHNVGHYRYLECSRMNENGQPDGDITPWDEVVFALDPALHLDPELEHLEVCRSDAIERQVIEERYLCNAHGMIEVTITNRTAGYDQTYRLREAPARRPKRKNAG
jgi:molecular chaperone DnaK